LFRTGRKKEGIAEVENAIHLDSGSRQLARLGRMYGQFGRKADARRVLQQLLERRKYRYVHAFFIGWVYEGLREFEHANVWMNEAIKEHEQDLMSFKTEADDLDHANPYFPEWLKKIGMDK
jgi:tetratricopeptide (TPR) repeat protein